jgi:hypothetical protein
MAFGIKRHELIKWKKQVTEGNNIAFLTHFWLHPRYPGITTVTKAGCSDIERLVQWGSSYGLKKEWIHLHDEFPHFDLIGDKQREILHKEKLWEHLRRFKLQDD